MERDRRVSSVYWAATDLCLEYYRNFLKPLGPSRKAFAVPIGCRVRRKSPTSFDGRRAREFDSPRQRLGRSNSPGLLSKECDREFLSMLCIGRSRNLRMPIV